MDIGFGLNRKTSREGTKEKRKKEHEVHLDRNPSIEEIAAKSPSSGAPAQISRWPHFKVQTLGIHLLQTSYNASSRCYDKNEGKSGTLAPDFSR